MPQMLEQQCTIYGQKYSIVGPRLDSTHWQTLIKEYVSCANNLSALQVANRIGEHQAQQQHKELFVHLMTPRIRGYGWFSERHETFMLFNAVDSQSIISKGELHLPCFSAPPVFLCPNGDCHKEDSRSGHKLIWVCGMCHTRHCSDGCYQKDSHNHKVFCTSKQAFNSRLEEWKEDTSEQVRDTESRKDYIQRLSNWLNSEDIRCLLEHTKTSFKEVIEQEMTRFSGGLPISKLLN